jgi:hypothetical protein
VTPDLSQYAEPAGVAVGALLTIMTLSYFFGIGPLYRIALHVFIGALVGYSLGIVLREVFIRMLFARLQSERILIVPLTIGLWLFLFKSLPRLAYVGNFAVAFLIGVGAAVALAGAVLGVLIPQTQAAWLVLTPEHLVRYRLGLMDGLLSLLGTVCTLLFFHYTRASRSGLTGIWARALSAASWLGRWFVTAALAVAYAGALTASLTTLVGRLRYLVAVASNLLQSAGM